MVTYPQFKNSLVEMTPYIICVNVGDFRILNYSKLSTYVGTLGVVLVRRLVKVVGWWSLRSTGKRHVGRRSGVGVYW